MPKFISIPSDLARILSLVTFIHPISIMVAGITKAGGTQGSRRWRAKPSTHLHSALPPQSLKNLHTLVTAAIGYGAWRLGIAAGSRGERVQAKTATVDKTPFRIGRRVQHNPTHLISARFACWRVTLPVLLSR